MRLLVTIVAAGLAGAVGFYGGLAVLLAFTGLDAPGWAPVAAVAGAGLCGAAAAGLTVRLPAALVAGMGAAGGLAGALAGLAVMHLGDSFDAAIVAAAVLVVAAAAAGHALKERRLELVR